MHPTVSILIPCFNAEPWLAEAIESALGQTYSAKEVIVVDDGSHDVSLSIIRGFGARLRFETGPNRGGNVARNRLLEISNGEWLSFLDADDYLLPQKIEKQVQFLSERPDLDVVYSPACEISDDPAHKRLIAADDDDLFANYFRWSLFSTNSLFLRKVAVMDVGGWKEDQPVCQEHELILRLMLAGKRFAIFPEAHVVNRIHSKPSVSIRSPLRTIEQRMQLSETLERFLVTNGKMSDVRKRALAQARFECARSAYPYDRQYAKALMAKARASMAGERFKNANPLYGACLSLGGMEFAEGLASVRRRLVGRFA
jgi:glycosyltransferase involved in cell wall biosynthesis